MVNIQAQFLVTTFVDMEDITPNLGQFNSESKEHLHKCVMRLKLITEESRKIADLRDDLINVCSDLQNVSH